MASISALGVRIIMAVVLLLISAASVLGDWPTWRGPHGTGAGESEDLPVSWGPQENVIWQTALPAWSGSSPIVVGDRVFVMSPSEVSAVAAGPADEAPAPARGRGRGGRGRAGAGASEGPGGQDILLLCLSREDGSILWRAKLDRGNEFRMKHNSSSPSPVTDGKRVWAVTGNGRVTALDFDGNELWRFDLQDTYGAFGLNFGYASSPLLHDGKLYCQVLHGMRTSDPSYLVAFDAATGEVLWRHERPTDARSESPDAYTTPALLATADRAQIVITGGDYVTGHDPATGAEVWRAAGLNPRHAGNYRIVASPVVVEGMIIAPTRRTPLLALRGGGNGDVTESHLVWKWDRQGSPDVPTPVSDGRHLYMADDRGALTCVDLQSGESVWGPEDLGIGSVSASPVLADGKLFVISESAECAVVRAGGDYKLLGRNQLDGTFTLSTPAATGRHLFIRTATHLYCIGKP